MTVDNILFRTDILPSRTQLSRLWRQFSSLKSCLDLDFFFCEMAMENLGLSLNSFHKLEWAPLASFVMLNFQCIVVIT